MGEKGEPKPTFSWFIDDNELTETKTFDAELSQTIELELTADRSNKTLKCLVNFGKTLPELEQSEVLNYNYDVGTFSTIITPVVDVVTANAYPAIVTITVLVCFAVLSVGLLQVQIALLQTNSWFRCRKRRKGKQKFSKIF